MRSLDLERTLEIAKLRVDEYCQGERKEEKIVSVFFAVNDRFSNKVPVSDSLINATIVDGR